MEDLLKAQQVFGELALENVLSFLKKINDEQWLFSAYVHSMFTYDLFITCALEYQKCWQPFLLPLLGLQPYTLKECDYQTM